MTAPAGNAALYFVPEAFTTAGRKLMGRNAAGESFLKGLARHARLDRFVAFVPDPAFGAPFKNTIAALGRREPVEIVGPADIPALVETGALHMPAPGLGDLARKRSLFGDRAWSLTGITHTTASAAAMDGIVDLLTAPLQPWDAVICTSAAVRDNVEQLWDAQRDYLRTRLGATRFVTPELPVIPLGIVTADFQFSSADRRAARALVGADETTVVVLFSGRLSFHAKAHPLAMYQAVAAAAPALPAGGRVLLVECGWHANESIADAFAEAAAVACPGIEVRVLDGRKPDDRRAAWASADIFCSLSDNIQETFGLVPVEGMAAGLPCVVSDWNGYKDTVRDGVDGFRIATLAPAPGGARDLAVNHALEIESYDTYLGQSCMLVSVDIGAATEAFRKLFADRMLRRRMGESGRLRARTIFDWSAIIPRYQALWAELGDRRRAAAIATPQPRHPWPARLEPFTAFAAYPTKTLSPDTMFELDGGPATARAKHAAFEKLRMVAYARHTHLHPEELDHIIAVLTAGPASADALVAALPAERKSAVYRALIRLAKLGIVRARSV